MNASIAAAILWDLCAWNRTARIPEPEQAMTGIAQVDEYAQAAERSPATQAAHVFHTAYASSVIHGARHVVDLGCGPATQLVRLAELHPRTQFLGVDLSKEMLERGREEIQRAGVSNVELREADLTNLSFLENASTDAVMSTMTLHHLPGAGLLVRALGETARILRPGGALYLADFGRLRTNTAMHAFAHLEEHLLPKNVLADYSNSLRAAFTPADFRACLPLLPENAKLSATALIPLLMILHTPLRPLSATAAAALTKLREDLPPIARRNLDDLRFFFRLGGLKGNPFTIPTAESCDLLHALQTSPL